MKQMQQILSVKIKKYPFKFPKKLTFFSLFEQYQEKSNLTTSTMPILINFVQKFNSDVVSELLAKTYNLSVNNQNSFKDSLQAGRKKDVKLTGLEA